MPRTRASVAAPVPSAQESPRKRKRVNGAPPAQHAEDGSSDASDTNAAAVPKPVKREAKRAPLKKQQETPSAPTVDPLPSTKRASKRTKVVREEAKEDATEKAATKVELRVEEEDQKEKAVKVVANRKKVNVKPDESSDGDQKPEKTSRKRKTKEEKEAEAMPLAARTQGLKKFVGAHVSIAKGVENAITNSLHIGGNAFALFLKSQRKWDNPALKDENRIAFKQQCTHHQYDASSHVVPHGSYLVNLATPDKDMAKKSYDAFVDDLHRCEKLGIKYYNFHPGTTNKEPLSEAIGRLAENLNRALAETSTVVPLLENMAGRGSVIGSRFSDLRDIIAGIKPEFKSRIGICIDTCHTFAAGYDLRTPEAFKKTFQELDEVVGLQYLKAMHLNDSKAPFDSHRDLHQNIGVGFLGLRAFHNVMNDSRLENIPLILETPCDKPDPKNPKKTIEDKNSWAQEIKLLESLIGMDAESTEFKKLEADLSEQGRAEREKMQQSVDAKEKKERKKAEKEAIKGQKTISGMLGGKGKKKRRNSVSSTSSLSEVESEH